MLKTIRKQLRNLRQNVIAAIAYDIEHPCPEAWAIAYGLV